MTSKTLALTAAAALAVPAAAQAKKPAEPGKKGRDNGAQKQSAKADKQAKTKGVGFSVKGTGVTTLPVADGALTGPLTLDPTSANRHARTLLTLTKADLRGSGTETFGVAGDKVIVEFDGLTAADGLQATDVVKISGKVTRTGKGKAKTLGTLDIRKITITREPAEQEQPEQEQPASDQQSQS